MVRSVITALFLVFLFSPQFTWAQQAEKFKSFNKYTGLVPGIDFFASKRQSAEPYVKPVAQAIDRLKTLLGENLPKGAIFICSTLEQKDSIYEPMILKMGYSWTLSVESQEIQAEQMMARMKSMMGDDEIPAEIMERLKSRQSYIRTSADTRTVNDTIRRVANAIIQTSFAENLHYRSSRVNDVIKSPLPDWLDIGIAVYAMGDDPNLSYLLQNMEQTFPIDDVLTMSRPFVASTFLRDLNGGSNSGSFGSRGGGRSSSNDGQGFPQGGFGGMEQGGSSQGGFPQGGFGGMGQGGSSQGGFPQGGFGGMSQGGSSQGGFPQGGFGGRGEGSSGRTGGQRGGGQRTIPKDEQDQMIFDGQASTFFTFLLEKVGIEKIRELISAVRNGTEGRDFIARPDMLGDDFRRIEQQWTEYVRNLTPPQPSFPGSGMPKTKEGTQTTSISE
jgi:hypothetical protein